jgi:hypothetical protein
MDEKRARDFAIAALVVLALILYTLLTTSTGWGATVQIGASLPESADTVHLKMYVGDALSFDSTRVGVQDLSTSITVASQTNTVFWYEGKYDSLDNAWAWAWPFIDVAGTAIIPVNLPETAHSVRRVYVGDDTTYSDSTFDSVMVVRDTLTVVGGITSLRYDIRYNEDDSASTLAFPPFVVKQAATANDTTVPVKFVLADIGANPLDSAKIYIKLQADTASVITSADSSAQLFPPVSLSASTDTDGEATINLYPNAIFTGSDTTWYTVELRATDRYYDRRLLRYKFRVPASDSTVLFHLLDTWR